MRIPSAWVAACGLALAWAGNEPPDGEASARPPGDAGEASVGEPHPEGDAAGRPQDVGQASAPIDPGVFSGDHFRVYGRVASLDRARSELTIERRNQPAARLLVDPRTRIQLGGRIAAIDDLEPGTDVRATFNLSGDRPIAIRIDGRQVASPAGGAATQPGSSQGPVDQPGGPTRSGGAGASSGGR